MLRLCELKQMRGANEEKGKQKCILGILMFVYIKKLVKVPFPF
jgi:hypothetical protein